MTPVPQLANAHAPAATESIVWIQGAASVAELRQLDFWLVVDGARSILQNATCDEEGGSPAKGFECKAPLPALADGRHDIQVVSGFRGSSGHGSGGARSLSLIVFTEAGRTVSTSADPRPSMPPPPPTGGSRYARPPRSSPMVAWATDLHDPRLLSPASRDLLFFVAGSAQVYSATSAGAAPVPVSVKTPGVKRILAIAPHPRFATTCYMFIAWFAAIGSDNTDVRVRRYVWDQNRLTGEADVARVRVRHSDASALMAFGPDSKLYLVLPSSPHSLIYRFNDDGTVPAEHTSRDAVFALGPPEASALAWNPRTSDLWCVGNSRDGAQVLVFPTRGQDAFARLPLRGNPPPGTETTRRRQAQRVSSLVFISRPSARTADLLAVVPDGPGEVVRLSIADTGAIRIAGRYPSGPEGRVMELSTRDGELFMALQTATGRGVIGVVPGGNLQP